MAEYIENVAGQGSKLDWAFPFQRTGSFPIDRSSLFSSLEDAQKYASGEKDANGDALDSRKLGGSSYAGQVIAVYNAATTVEGVTTPASITAYIIQPDRTLKEVGAVYNDEELRDLIAELDDKIGTLPEKYNNETVENVVDYINKKTAGIATDAALGEL
jgi:hypothetical protein